MSVKIPKWEQFELDCVDFLNKEFHNYNVKFKSTGKSDSTSSDILVLSNDHKNIFSIECKYHPSQSGQFVLLIENNQFVFSPRNKSILDDFSKEIINYMNNNFDNFKDVSTRSIKISLPNDVFNGWIQNHYKNLNTKFIITHNSKGKNLIFPIEKLSNYFTISANFRIKTSGSRPLPIKDLDAVNNYLNNIFKDKFSSLSKIDKHYIVNYNYYKLDKNYKFTLGDYSYQIDCNTNIITKLGTTKNPNVIFALSYTKFEDTNDLDKFTTYLSKL